MWSLNRVGIRSSIRFAKPWPLVSAYINETPGQGKQHNKHTCPRSPGLHPRPARAAAAARPPPPRRHPPPSPPRVALAVPGARCSILSSSRITSRSSDLAGDRRNLVGTLVPAISEGPSGRSPAGIAPRSSSLRHDVEVISLPRCVSAGTEKRRRRLVVRVYHLGGVALAALGSSRGSPRLNRS